MIAVTFALPAESSGFLRRLHKKTRTDRNGIRVIRGEIDNREIGARESFRNRTIEVLHTGVGEKICRQRMGSFLQDRQFDCLISDTPSKPLPAPASVLFNMERQRTDLTKLTLHVLKHPGVIPRLIAFARKIAQAREILANAILGVVRGL